MKKRLKTPDGPILPTEPSEAVVDLGSAIITIYGREGVGKTSFAAQFPDALFLCTEPGARHLRVMRVELNSWANFQRACKEAPGHACKTIVIDTVDVAYDMCQRATCRRLGVEHPSEGDYGKVWDMCRREFAAAIEPIMMCGKGVIFISHESERDLSRRSGATETRIAPSVSKTAAKTILPRADIVAYYGYGEGRDEDKRYIQLKGDDMIFAKNRWADVFSASTIDASGDAATAYQRFIQACGGEGPTPARKMKVARKSER